MKQFMKYSCLVMLACMTAFIAQSKVINIDIDAIKGDLTTQLNAMCEKATYDDTAVLNFGRGKYTIDGTIMLRCNVVIKGQGSDKSTVIIDNNPAKPLTTDTYFMLHGTLANTINVSISDITFRMREHKGIWWKGIEKYIFQIHHANKVDMHNVESYLADANATNFNLHVCSNVTVTDCIFSNYNNSEIGGCLWLRGEMHNVHVWNNKFYKYGKDEALAVFDRLVDNSRKYIRGKANRTNILIEDNDIYYGEYKGNNKKDPESNCGMATTSTMANTRGTTRRTPNPTAAWCSQCSPTTGKVKTSAPHAISRCATTGSTSARSLHVASTSVLTLPTPTRTSASRITRSSTRPSSAITPSPIMISMWRTSARAPTPSPS